MTKHRSYEKTIRCEFLLISVLLLLALLACGGGNSAKSSSNAPPVAITVTIAPGTASVDVGGTQQFTATVTGTSNQAVTWSVQEASGGTVSASGNYTAPLKAGSYHLAATSQADNSKSATVAVAVTAPVPVFSTEAPTGAAEAVLYQYVISASDPAGTPVNLALTDAPEGAVMAPALNGDAVLTWTPTWNQSRKPNAFTVTAKSEAGGVATQSWSVAPVGTIYGHNLLHYWGGGIENVAPYPAPAVSREPRALMAWVPQPDGSLLVQKGVTHDDGTFEIPNVPAGPYFFSPAGREKVPEGTWEASSTINWDLDIVGSKGLDPSQWWIEFQTYNINGLDPFNCMNDLLDIYDRDGYSDFMVLCPAGSPYEGMTSYTLAQWAYQNAPSGSDRIVAVQIEAKPGIEPFAGFTYGPAWVQPFSSISDGKTETTYAGQLTRTTPGTFDLNVAFSEFANAFQSAGPGAFTPYDFQLVVASEGKPPKTTLSNAHMYDTWVSPTVAMAVIQNGDYGMPDQWPKDGQGNSTWPADKSYGTMEYNNPLATEEKTVYVNKARAAFAIPIPGTKLSLPWYASMTSFTTEQPTGPIKPLMTPPANPKVDGFDFPKGGMLASATPTITWSAPVVGPNTTADSLTYDVFVCEVKYWYDRGGQAHLGCETTIYVGDIPANSFTVPKGMLLAGHSYLIELKANSRREYDPNSPFQWSYPMAMSTVVSNVVTVPDSGGGKGIASSSTDNAGVEITYPEIPLPSVIPALTRNTRRPYLNTLPTAIPGMKLSTSAAADHR